MERLKKKLQMGKLTINNIREYIEGNLNMLKDEFFGKPYYFKEQIIYRQSKCTDCYRLGKCLTCGCELPGKHYVVKSCNNGLRFPDLMNEEDWNEYKKANGIKIKLTDTSIEIDVRNAKDTDSL